MTSIGTSLYTFLNGTLVGTDEFGNRYYKTSDRVNDPKKEHRWVVYKGMVEPSKVPPCWHGWLHHQTAELPVEKDCTPPYSWRAKHLPNLTGTKYAYYPSKKAREKADG